MKQKQKKAPARGAAKGKKGAPAGKVGGDDWLGEQVPDEEVLKLGGAAGASDSEEPDEVDDDDDNDDEEDLPAIADGEPADDDEGEPNLQALPSRLLAKTDGVQPGDLAALKQRIEDDVTLLMNWRKSQGLGHGRERQEVFRTLVSNCALYYSYSEELAEYFLQMFNPEEAVKFFDANDQHRPLTIRTNSLKARRSSLIQALSQRRASVDPVGDWTKVGLKVYDSQVPVGATPEYLGGHYMIQSASSLIPVMALAPQQNETVLDMAAAPGGKTTYVGQLMRNTGTLFANDSKKERCKSLMANVHRMGLTNVVVTNVDGRKLKGMLPKMDRILLDAPCSGSGIIARDPSIKVKRGAKAFEENSALQKELLAVAVDLVDANSKTGGYIVYSTCSVSVEENEAVLEHILGVRHVELVSFTSSVGFGVEGFTKYRERRFHPSMKLARRYYPHIHNMDGFFVAKLKKLSNEIPQRIKKNRVKGGEVMEVWGEEKWTDEMLNTVVDFKAKADQEDAPAADGKPLNKRDRKKLKRAQVLKERERAQAAQQANAAGPGPSETAVKEPEEEPQTEKPALKKGKLPLKRKAPKAEAEPEEKRPSRQEVAKAANPESKPLKRKASLKRKAPKEEKGAPAEVSATPPAEKRTKVLKKRKAKAAAGEA